MKAFLVLVLGFLVSTVSLASTEKKEFDAKGLNALRVRNGSGDITISVSKDSKAHVTAEKIKADAKCTFSADISGADLIVRVERPGWSLGDNCTVNLDIRIPEALALDLDSGSGNLNVLGTKGKVKFDLGSGNATVNAPIKELRGDTGSGSMTVEGLQGSAQLETGSGNIEVTYASPVKEGLLQIKTGSGNATVIFPKKMKISTDVDTGSGQTMNELGDSPDAKFRVSMSAGSGNLSIKKAK